MVGVVGGSRSAAVAVVGVMGGSRSAAFAFLTVLLMARVRLDRIGLTQIELDGVGWDGIEL